MTNSFKPPHRALLVALVGYAVMLAFWVWAWWLPESQGKWTFYSLGALAATGPVVGRWVEHLIGLWWPKRVLEEPIDVWLRETSRLFKDRH